MGLRTRVLALSVVMAAVMIAAVPTSTASASGAYRHCVKPGETLWGIAHRYGMSAYSLAHYNGLYNPNYIRAGQCLKVPSYGGYGRGGYGYGGYNGGYYYQPNRCDQNPASCYQKQPAYGHGAGYGRGRGYGYKYGGYHGGRYCVRQGDTLYSIGRRFGVNPYAIATANAIYNPNCIYIGQCLTIP